MIMVVFNAQTKETTQIETSDFEMPITLPEFDTDEELAKAIAEATTISSLKNALLNAGGGIARVKGIKK